MRHRCWVLMIIVLSMAMCFGCSPSSDTGPPPIVEYDRTTPSNLLKYLAHAYEEEEIGDYEESLNRYFLFEFTDEVAGELGLPADKPWWGKSDDLGSTGRMFEADEVVGISMDYVYEQVAEDEWYICEEFREEYVTGRDTTFYGKCCRVTPDIKVTFEITGEEDLIRWVNQSWLDITVVPDPDIIGLWTVLRILEIEKPI